MFPLGVVEVTLRNAIDALLVTQHGATWHLDAGFRDTVLMPAGLSTLDKAIQRAGVGAARGRVVAELTFDFWSNLFRPDYGALWRTGLNIVFPNLPKATTRRDIQTMARSINQFRNRVAHHEPVLDLNVTDVYAQYINNPTLRALVGGRHLGTIPAYDLLSLDLQWKSVQNSPFDLSFFRTNVTKKKYLSYVGGLTGAGFETAALGSHACMACVCATTSFSRSQITAGGFGVEEA